MKKKDLILIVAVAIVASIFSFIISNFLITGGSKQLEAETVQKISSEFQSPDKNVFNEQAINPTKLIEIGNNNNQKPF